MVKLSIIIPIYNSEKYLRQCMTSLMEQTYRDLEIICVNDGSADASGDIAQEYAERDMRITVIDQKNQGMTIARRNGYFKATGDYVTFVDSDDWLELDTYEKILSCMSKDDSDVGIFNFYCNDGNRQRRTSGYKEYRAIEERDLIYQLALSGLVGKENPIVPGRLEGWLWNKVYRKSIFEELRMENKLFIDDVRHFEDALLNIRLLKKCRKVSLLPYYGYHYRKENVQSISTKYYTSLPEKKDFLWYEHFGRDLSLDDQWDTVRDTMLVNLFWSYVNKRYYFQRQNPLSFKSQLREINLLLKGKPIGDYYFPIKEALGGQIWSGYLGACGF